MPGPPGKDAVAACHEAGHAVGAFLLGVPFGEVSLAAPDSGEGSVRSPLTVKEIRESDLQWEHAVILMLGREAERLVFGRADRSFLQGDAGQIVRLYLTFFDSDMTCQRFRAELRGRTREVARRPEFRRALVALARVVEAEKAVSSTRATEVIRTAIASHSAP